MRIVAWNIRAGGGSRARGIADQIQSWGADIVVLSEFRGTPASQWIAASIAGDSGLRHQRTTANAVISASTNALLVASRWPLRRGRLSTPHPDRQRWLQVSIAAPTPLALLAVHVPNRVSGRKYPFLQAVTRAVENWRGPPALVVGDTNSGRIDIDEENPAFNRIEDDWIQKMGQLGWPDAYRQMYPKRREYTWYSPNGRNGFRLDQAFVEHRLAPRLAAFRYEWAGATAQRREVLSDHAAIVMDFL